jgi:peptide/nickel transport system ATP-binding protein
MAEESWSPSRPVVESGTLHDIFMRPEHPLPSKHSSRRVPHFDMQPGERLKPIREIKVATGTFLAKPQGSNIAGEKLIEVRGLCKSFGQRRAMRLFSRKPGTTVLALNDVSLHDQARRVPGLVGESGSGKSTCSKAIMRAVPMDKGEIIYHDGGRSTDLLRPRSARDGADPAQDPVHLQDPYSSLNPRMTVGNILAEPFAIHNIGNDTTRRAAVVRLLEMVGLGAQHMNRYPHSFSGGQRQRIGIARALALQPDLVICDEPVSALDVSIQAQILNLLKDCRRRSASPTCSSRTTWR